MYLGFIARSVFTVAVCIFLTACTTLVAPYDATFDQSLNKLSEDTARFLAAASKGGPERLAASSETAAYYATTYNLLERLSQRARLSRADVSCPTNASLATFAAKPTSKTKLSEDYLKFDCREFQLYSVRFFVDQLNYGHTNDGVLGPFEVKALGGPLQVAIMGAIQTFIVNKPS